VRVRFPRTTISTIPSGIVYYNTIRYCRYGRKRDIGPSCHPVIFLPNVNPPALVRACQPAQRGSAPDVTKKRLHAALRQSKEGRPAALQLSKKRRPAALRRPPAELQLSKKRRPAALRSPKSRLRLPKESWHVALRRSPRSLGRTSCRTVRRVSARSQRRTPRPFCGVLHPPRLSLPLHSLNRGSRRSRIGVGTS
jgi:hypothetical protein